MSAVLVVSCVFISNIYSTFDASCPLLTRASLRVVCWQNNPEIESLEAKLIDRLKGDASNDGKLLITLENISELQPDCWKRREYAYTW